MTTKAFVSQFKIRFGSNASPPVYTDLEEVQEIGGFGKSNALLEVTSFDSGLNKEYIGGLGDGVEITVKCNFIPEKSPPTQQQLLMTSVDAAETRAFRIANTKASPEKHYDFLAVCKDYKIMPSVEKQNSIEFTLKVTGNIVRS